MFYGWLQFQELGHWTTSSAIHSNTLEREKRGIQLLWQNYSIWDQQNLGERDRSFIVVQIKGIEENNILQNPDRGTITEIWKKYVKKSPQTFKYLVFSQKNLCLFDDSTYHIQFLDLQNKCHLFIICHCIYFMKYKYYYY